MKKITVIFSASILLILIVTCSAGPFPKHLNDDSDIVQIHQNTYIRKSSVNVIKYAPPEYTISIEVLVGDFDGNVTNKYTNKFFYEYDNKNMYYRGAGEWIYIQPTSFEAVNTEMRNIG
ncbi:hypothetical protein SAMN05216584_105157 [Selenomonas sp. WCT3]|uniref:hypothetical protein n=1 Tax=Selenomonas sp. WCT3 TaxID=3158785 RepID=UPI0008859FC9|nr:hypothetical protein SAMN05216584_105157 [Selenomonas ruminantium]